MANKKILDERQKCYLKRVIPCVAFIGGLCAFIPVVLVILGITTVAVGASVFNILFGQYEWVFLGGAGLFLVGFLIWYFYKVENIRSFAEFKKDSKRFTVFALFTVVISAVTYYLWTYIIMGKLGSFIGIW